MTPYKDPEKLKMWRKSTTMISLKRGTKSDLEDMFKRSDSFDFMVSRLVKFAKKNIKDWEAFYHAERQKREERRSGYH